jgi:hypothetical protein
VLDRGRTSHLELEKVFILIYCIFDLHSYSKLSGVRRFRTSLLEIAFGPYPMDIIVDNLL